MPLPVLSISRMREWEQASWAAGRSEAEVIQRVGRLIAERTLRLTRPGDQLLILAGKGHNGDDVRAAVPHLPERQTDLLNVTSPREQFATVQALLEARPALILDGLFGIGLNRVLPAEWVALVAEVNASGRPILAIDTPSGLNADTGQPMPTAIAATITLTLAAPKVGLLLPSALPFVGRLEVSGDIGLIPQVADSDLFWSCAEDFQRYPPPRAVSSHKGSFGHLGIIAGSEGFHGAAVLAARAGSRAQPGLITVWTHERTYLPVAAQLQSTMVHPWRLDLPAPERVTALVIGPGLAYPLLDDAFKAQVRELWCKFPKPLLVDASALDWLPAGPIQTDATRVITPHPGEAARMLQRRSESVQSDRRGALAELSHRFGGCIVVLKGHQSLIGRNGSAAYVNSSGNPFLAQGGSGDVLSGYLGGLLAQPSLQTDPLFAIRYGVWRHGLASDKLTESGRSWNIEDLLESLASATNA